VQIFGAYLCGKLLVGSQLTGQLTHNLGYLFIQFTNAALTGVRFDDRLQRLFRELHFSFRQTVNLQLFRDQMTGSDFHLFFHDITTHFDQLHTIQQRLGNRVQVIGSRDKHNFAQVIIYIQIIIMESIVLLRVQHLKQSGSWISLEIIRYLVNLVKNKHGV